MLLRSWRLMAAAGIAAGVLATASSGAVALGRPAPKWSGKTVQGQPISAAQFKGKVVLMNFFSYT
jgi:hypothetical protein